jgi:tetratricopeptide (TPR) repeat protein
VALLPPAAKSDPIAAKVSTLLVKADSYIANRQYDKAIATAESALELDPGNSGARAMISIAKSRQTEALRSGSSLE